MPGRLRFTFHGVRGSSAIDRPDSARYGGSTTCISAPLSDHHYLVLDAGTGLRDLQRYLPDEGGLNLTFLVTHFHLDHLLGIPFFKPLYHPDNRCDFYAKPWEGVSVEEAISGVMRPPLFPVELQSLRSTRSFIDVPGAVWEIGPITVTAASLSHPQGVTAYRIDHDAGSLVLATDFEAGDDRSDNALIELAADADVLIHDAQYLPDELARHKGWGHSSWEQATEIAVRAGVERLILTHHDPTRTDAQIDALLGDARSRFPDTDAAYAGMQVDV